MAEGQSEDFDWTGVLASVPLDRADLVGGSLHDDIYASLREALVMGDLVPGQRFSMRALADKFNTSLIPVRDALKRLVAERGLIMAHNRTVCVPLMTRSRFQELLQVRMSLESMLARRGAELIEREAVAELQAVNSRMQAAVGEADVKTYLAANYRFHFGLYRAAGSEVMLPIVESLWLQIGPFFNALFTSRGTRNARDNHAEVLKALRRRDPVAAGDAIMSDIADAADVILANVEFICDRKPQDGDPIVMQPRPRRIARAGKRPGGDTPARTGRL